VHDPYAAHLLHFGVADDAICASLGRGPFEVTDQITLCGSGNAVWRGSGRAGNPLCRRADV